MSLTGLLKVLAGLVPFGGSGKRIHLPNLSSSRGSLHSLVSGLLLILVQSLSRSSHLLLPTLVFLPPSSKNPVLTFGPPG